MDKIVKELSIFGENNTPPYNNTRHPFYERKVFIAGFSTSIKRELSNMVKSNGGTVANQISKNVHYVILDTDMSGVYLDKIEKLKHNGFNLRILNTEDVKRIESGDYESFITAAEIIKDLDLTYSHVEKHSVDMSITNPITGKEIYIGDNFKGSVDILRQMAGNLSAYGNPTMYEDTNICLLSNETTELLYKGEKDNTVKLIQDYYNSHKSPTFKLSFLTEKKFLDFIARWCNTYQDDVTYDLYVSFLNSKYL